MRDMREIKCETCPRVCPEDYQKMVEKCSRVCQERDRANEMLRKEQEAHRWIPVAERLPETERIYNAGTEDEFTESCKVLALDNEETVFMAFLVRSEKLYWVEAESIDEIIGVTHWMPLPKPPEVTHA